MMLVVGKLAAPSNEEGERTLAEIYRSICCPVCKPKQYFQCKSQNLEKSFFVNAGICVRHRPAALKVAVANLATLAQGLGGAAAISHNVG